MKLRCQSPLLEWADIQRSDLCRGCWNVDTPYPPVFHVEERYETWQEAPDHAAAVKGAADGDFVAAIYQTPSPKGVDGMNLGSGEDFSPRG